ncbi:Condensin complex subunit 1 [Astathelohania contejeani]|uniref:Condensin complex subunit 1 n=1 Tax=Astathelohania contejeani TaxID=164912 RepID=A0ABQ7HW31_9MICR|nr:Condensin complex subunit 1 [Thelohania contejeani]
MEINELIKSLSSIKISTNPTEYEKLITNSTNYPNKLEIAQLIIRNSDDHTATLPLLYQLTGKTVDPIVMHSIINYLQSIKEQTKEQQEWSAKILFNMLQGSQEHKRSEIQRRRIYEMLWAMGTNIIHLTADLFETAPIIGSDILKGSAELAEEVARAILSAEGNINQQKNFSSILPTLPSIFTNERWIASHGWLLNSEHYFLRNCYLEIISNNIINEKKVDLIPIITERLYDINYLVRYKAIQLIYNLFENNLVPLVERNKIIESVGERIKDKAVIVRKKAILFCSHILMNHPFTYKTFTFEDIPISEDEEKKQYFQDRKDFHDQMVHILENINQLIRSNTDSVECIEFIKLAYFYKIKNAKLSFKLLFNLNDDGFLSILMENFKDLFMRIGSGEEGIIEFLCEIIDDVGYPYERIIRAMTESGVINGKMVDILYSKILHDNTANYYLYTYYLAIIHSVRKNQPLDKHLLDWATKKLFSSKTEYELKNNLDIYKNTLRIILNCKCDVDEVIPILVKNIIKMNFFDYESMDLTVALIYQLTGDPEFYACEFIGKLCIKNPNLLKIIYAVGCIAIKHVGWLETLEKRAKMQGMDVDKSVVIPEEVRERRRSINASRASITSIKEENTKNEKVDENAKQTQEEIADLFFFIREREMIYGVNSLIPTFIPSILEIIKNDQESELLNIAYITLFRFMCVSSEFFLNHLETFVNALNHRNQKIRNNAIIAMSDFILSYNSIIEPYTAILFDKLQSKGLERTNSLQIIYYLVVNNILKIKGHGVDIAKLLCDDDEEIRRMARGLLLECRESVTVFYEALVNYESIRDIKEVINFMCRIVEKEKMRDQLFVKVKEKIKNEEILNYLKFELGVVVN